MLIVFIFSNLFPDLPTRSVKTEHSVFLHWQALEAKNRFALFLHPEFYILVSAIAPACRIDNPGRNEDQ